MLPGNGGGRAGEHLVPGGEAGPRAIGEKRQLGGADFEAPVRIAVGQLGEIHVEPDRLRGLRIGLACGLVAQLRGPLLQGLLVGPASARGRLFDQPCAHHEGQADVGDLHATLELLAP